MKTLENLKLKPQSHRKWIISKSVRKSRRAMIEKLKTITDKDASDAQDSDLKYSNKLKALELLGKHVGAWEPAAFAAEGGVQIIDDL